jgi:hypothetical protein
LKLAALHLVCAALLGGCHALFPLSTPSYDAAADASGPTDTSTERSTTDRSADLLTDSSADLSLADTSAADGPSTDGPAKDAVAADLGPSTGWPKQFGGTNAAPNDDLAEGVALDSKGNAYLLMTCTGSGAVLDGAVLPGTTADLYLGSFTPAGARRWHKRMGGGSNDFAGGLAVDGTDHAVVTGWFIGATNIAGQKLGSKGGEDVVVARFDPGGALKWAKGFGSKTDDRAYAAAADQAGNIYLTGWARTNISFGGQTLVGSGDRDFFAASLKPDGSHRWSWLSQNVKHDGAHAVAVAGSSACFHGRFFNMGYFGGPIFMALGAENDLFVVCYGQATRQHIWSTSLSSLYPKWPGRLATDATGNLYVSGSFSTSLIAGGKTLTSAGKDDIYLASFDATGQPRWSRRLGSADDEGSGGLAVGSDGHLYLAATTNSKVVDLGCGSLPSKGVGTKDVVVARLDAASGKCLWSERLGGVGHEVAVGLAVWGQTKPVVYVTGTFTGTTTLGGKTLTSLGGNDVFLIRVQAP